MSIQKKFCFVALTLVVLCLSCTRTPQDQLQTRGDIVVEKLPQRNSVPIEWGNLVSATIQPGSQTWTQLWFQDERGDIRVVLFSQRLNRLADTACLIPRKQGEGNVK